MGTYVTLEHPPVRVTRGYEHTGNVTYENMAHKWKLRRNIHDLIPQCKEPYWFNGFGKEVCKVVYG